LIHKRLIDSVYMGIMKDNVEVGRVKLQWRI
jgi:hypothetical protein